MSTMASQAVAAPDVDAPSAVDGAGEAAPGPGVCAKFFPFIVLLPGGRPLFFLGGCPSPTALAARFSPAMRISLRYLQELGQLGVRKIRSGSDGLLGALLDDSLQRRQGRLAELLPKTVDFDFGLCISTIGNSLDLGLKVRAAGEKQSVVKVKGNESRDALLVQSNF